MLKSKIMGCLVGAAAGDAMGAPTELRTRKQIEEKFGGYVTEFLDPPNDTFARGGKAGEVTDDFSLAYTTLLEIIENDGELTEEVGKNSLIKWSNKKKYFDRFAGPTTRAAIAEMKGIKLPGPDLFIPVNDNFKTTNGVGMKMSPISLVSKDVDDAIRMSVDIGKITHDNNKSISAGAAIAAATAEALKKEASLISVVNAGIYGAEKGEEIARKESNTYAGPSVLERMKLAISIGYQSSNLSEAIDELSDLVGSGLQAAEAIPCVFGLMIAANGNTQEAIFAGVNIGNDTDTVATMLGGILGALNGSDSLPKSYKKIIEKRNGYDFEKTVKKVMRIKNE